MDLAMQRQLKTGISDVFPELTEDVIGRMRNAASPRLRAVMEILIRHLHAFVRESRLTQEEWGYAVDFLTRTGQICSPQRQEFILLSDILGVSMLVDAVNHRSGVGITDSTVLGPFYTGRQRELGPGEAILLRQEDGEPVTMTGKVSTEGGAPIQNALVEV